jgi:signal transduction histidine kinase
MDTKLAPLIAEEAARPHFLYDPYMAFEPPKSKGDVEIERVPSPLLTAPDANVILNFNAASGGVWQSPQAPPPELTSFACANGMTLKEIESNRARLDELSQNVVFSDLLAQLPQQPVVRTEEEWAAAQADKREAKSRDRVAASEGAGDPFSSAGAIAPNAEASGDTAPLDRLAGAEQRENGAGGYANETPSGQALYGANLDAINEQKAQQSGKGYDLGARNKRVQQQVSDEYARQQLENVYRQRGNYAEPTPVIENVTRPLWVGDELLLARRVVRSGTTMVQGSWLNWPRLKRELLDETADLVPGADLVPVRPGEQADPTRMLAGLPARLVAASLPPQITRAASPLRWALGVGWAALAAALAAVAALLRGVLALSERRAAFVSSVTHELRTPLTTFRMYAEMLVRDMVPTPERRREYLQTLRTEAERLTHLVDNVLAYARLERGRKPRRAERTTPAALMERFASRLSERAEAAEMSLERRVDPAAADAPLETDVGVVEQILFNLVDNAAKYAGRAEDRRIHLDVARDGRFVALTVRDHGPGFASLRAAERTAPFSKSAEQAAVSAPGVGLGLALCRRLARELRGQLAIALNQGEPGAAITLRLPVDG